MAKFADAFDDAVDDGGSASDAGWAANIKPGLRHRIDDYVARYQAGEDLDDPTGRGPSLSGEERAIMERLHPDVAAQMEADGEAAWAANVEPGVRDRIDDFIARYQAGEDMDSPDGRGSLSGEEHAILERLHPDVAAQMEAGGAPVLTPPDDGDDPLGVGPSIDPGADDGGQPVIVIEPMVPDPDGITEIEQIEPLSVDVMNPDDFAVASAVVPYEAEASEVTYDVDDDGPIDYGGSINDDPDDYQPN
jgi:hypothetical protein